ncbi:hypothetical protein BCF46_3020 [Litoreibacter meonggei]|uniref:Uncharacterized protein n=1 Tax=Litoreibacter meonggei TaxID=1049199 RepID=A0A497VD62_9RHOB|nr:hypothetical protein BCF46_3020 [Litoreibacter meonggei]
METIPLAFYAVICGLLSLAAPSFGGVLPRVAIGAIVGASSAAVLPSLIALMY